jgi:Tfp pilus assembly protein PilF
MQPMPILPLLFLLSIPQLSCSASTPAGAAVERSAVDSVDELLIRGRALFAEGKFDEALAVFESAEQQDKGSLRTRVFVLRTWIAQGRIEEALGETDALKRSVKSGIELDYLYGMGFYAMAARDVASGQTTSVTGSQFEDALNLLEKVGAQNDERFEDAWLALADAAWYAGNSEVGEAAAEKAVQLAPNDPWRRLLRGKLALAAFANLNADSAEASAAEVQWQAALAAFQKAIAICGDAPSALLRPAAQQAQLQLATTYLWKQQTPDAGRAYARAIALDPTQVDYAAINGALPSAEFLDCLESAHKQWSASHPSSDVADAALLWWVGFANYDAKRFAPSEKAFESALAKNPSFTNALYYLFRVRYDQQEFAKSLETLHEFDSLDSAGLIASLSFDVVGNTARMEYLIGWAVTPENHKGKTLNLEAAFLCELITQIVERVPENSRHWNNLGLFLRDEGDAIRGTQGALRPAPKPFDEAKATQLWEDALVAYEVSLELEPLNPNYLNDTAVMLHFYLLRDLERAKQMYAEGLVQATALLARTDLTPTRREEVKIAERDTRNNVRLVQQLIDKRAAEAAAAAAAKAKDEKPADQ